MNTAANAGNIIEGLALGISIERKNNIYEKMLLIYKNAIEAAFQIESIELPFELKEDICTKLFQKENLLKYLDCSVADELIINEIKSVFDKYDVPYEEQNINIHSLTYIIMNKVYRAILNDSDLVIICTNVIPESVNLT